MNESDTTYLGDGVYATFDGEQIWLKANRLFGEHYDEHFIALDLFTYQSLVEYAKQKFGTHDVPPAK